MHRCTGGYVTYRFTLNVVDRSTQLGPDRKQLYTYPQTKEQQLDSLLSILSIGPNELMGQHEGKNVRSFSRYEYYLLDQAMNGKSWIQPLQQSLQEEAKPLIVPGKGKSRPGISVEPDIVTKHAGTA